MGDVAATASGVSIVIAVLDQLDYTRQCLASIQAHTDIPHEIIIIDNGSTDSSADVCRQAGCRVIRNDENLGCARAWNQGIRTAQFPLVCIMNNDVIVTPSWLRDLVAFQARTGFAVVSPSVLNGPCPDDLRTRVAAFTQRFGNQFRSGWRGECFLAPRTTYERAGLFDEAFVRGGFEDDDFDIRLRRVGLQTAVTGSVLIHHFGQITQRALAGGAWKRVKNPNKTHLETKWGWRLTLRRAGKELAKLWCRVRYPAFRGRDPYDVYVILPDEDIDLARGIKRHRSPPAAAATVR
jgi:GT2 family glycosyltransferase